MAIKRMTRDDIPLSFGAFKPIGHVVVALPDDARAEAAISMLRADGFEAEDVLYFSAAEEGDRMDRMLQHVSEFAGFGYEVTLMRRYQRLSREGCSWLLIYAPDDSRAAKAAAVVRQHGALIAEKYHRLVIEDLV